MNTSTSEIAPQQETTIHGGTVLVGIIAFVVGAAMEFHGIHDTGWPLNCVGFALLAGGWTMLILSWDGYNVPASPLRAQSDWQPYPVEIFATELPSLTSDD
jgi:hypothetical protein